MINIWNYKTMKLEISLKPSDEPQAVAFHPSGFHILVAFTDKVSMMNVLSSSIKEFNSVQMKNCREVRFSNGGHLFAAGGMNQGIYVFNFYTGECPSNMQCKGHATVRGIDWFEDDSGFCSTGGDSAYFYNLAYQRKNKSRIVDRDCIIKNSQFFGIAKIPDGKNENALVVGNDKMIRFTNDQNNFSDAKVVISQIQMLASGKYFFCGVGQDNKPGSVQIWKFPLEKINEIQAHG